MNENIKKEIKYYTSKSDKKIKMFIFIFKILRKINNKMFYFGLSLLTMLLLGNYFFNVSSFGILLTHMVFWELYHHKYLNPNEIKEDNEGLDLIINSLSKYLKNKQKI